MPRITVTTPNGLKQRYELDINMSTVTIGRDPDCEITIDDESISGFHAEIRRMNGGFCIVDCHSTRGVTVNGVRTEWAELANGQKVELGDVSLSFLFTDPEINQFLAEKANNPEAAPPASYHAPEAHPQPQAPVYAEAPVQQQQAVPAAAPAPFQAAPVQQSPLAQQPSPVHAQQQAAPAQPQSRLASPAVAGAPRPGMPGRPGMPAYNSQQKSSGGISGAYIITVLILCAAALLAGMTMRHYNETGRILFSDLFGAKEVKPVEKKPEPKPVVTPTVKEIAPVVKEKPVAKETVKKAAPAKDPMDGAIKSQGKDKLPSLDDFIIP